MPSYFQNKHFPEPDWSLLGGLAAPTLNPIVQAYYPMPMMTNLHRLSHIKGLTGTWMDTMPGRIFPGGGLHRMRHGHHLFGDGIKVLTNPKLSFAEFLGHLGCDFLTKQGIPYMPTQAMTDILFKGLQSLGLSANTANELLTINLPKLLGGSLSLVVTGFDVWACFSDTIPHTWAATGRHLALGAWNLIFGWWPTPNPLLLLAGIGEIGVGITTGIRTLIDTFYPTTQSLLDSASVAFPIWAQTAALSALLGACVGYCSGQSYEKIAKGAGITVLSSATAATISGIIGGNFIAPFIGGAAGFATGLLLRKIFLYNGETELAEQIKKPITNYFAGPSYFDKPSYFNGPSYFNNNGGVVMPVMQMPNEPIGRLKDGELLLDHKAIRKRFDV